MIGLCGSHRVGKTTLAQLYAERRRALFVETPVSAIWKALGIDPRARMSFGDRLKIQWEILQRTDELYAVVKPGTDAIADRTPLDMLMYTMAAAYADEVQPEDQELFARYTSECFHVTNKRFSTVLLVQPGIPIQDAEGKAVANRAYMEHLNSLCLGLTVDPRLKCAHYFIHRYDLDLEDRLRCVINANRRSEAFAQQAIAEHVAMGGVLQ